MMLPQETIRKKRNGGRLSPDELQVFFEGFMRGTVTDYQMTAFLMAVYFSGMDFEETIATTRLFLDSGARMDLSDIPGSKIDKHSTGGVGDKTSLLLLPIVAAAGVQVPMISGRGLGHTGGTLDKLESIPGFRTDLSDGEFLSVLRRTGMAVMGQSQSIVPLDRRIYALRDVTSTIEILPLIGASIMSKKIAVGSDGLVLDVKTGSGAFMERMEDAEELAQLLVRIGDEFGLPTVGFITDMSEPLGRAIGNWVEVVEVVDCLKGYDQVGLMEVTHALAGAMIFLGHKAASISEGMTISREMIHGGHALQKFLELVNAQHGDTRVIDETLRFPPATYMTEVYSESEGYVASIDSRALGLLACELGAGRTCAADTVDHTAGIVLTRNVGDAIMKEEPLCRLYSSKNPSLHHLRSRALTAFEVTSHIPRQTSRILKFFDQDGFSDVYLTA